MAENNWLLNDAPLITEEFTAAQAAKAWGWFGLPVAGEGSEFDAAATPWATETPWTPAELASNAAEGAGAPAINGSAVGRVGLGGALVAFKGAASGSVGRIGLAETESSRKNALGLGLGRIGLSAAEGGRHGALGASVGRFGLSAIATAVRAALGTGVGRFGLGGASMGAASSMQELVGSSTGRFGLRADEVGLRGSIATAVGRWGLSGAASSAVARVGAAQGRLGFSSASTASAAHAGTAFGRLGLTAANLSIAQRRNSASDQAAFGVAGAATGGQIEAHSGTGVGTFGFTGAALGIAGVATIQVPVDSGGALAMDFLDLLPSTRRKGSARGHLELVGSSRGVSAIATRQPAQKAPGPTLRPLASVPGPDSTKERPLDARHGFAAGSLHLRGLAKGRAELKLVVPPQPEPLPTPLIEPVAVPLAPLPESQIFALRGSARGSFSIGGSAAGSGLVYEEEDEMAIVLLLAA